MTEKYLVEYKMQNDAVIHIEATARAGIDRIDANYTSGAGESFEDALAHISPVANALFSAFEELNKPKEINVEFGIKFSAKAGVIFAAADNEPTFKVSLKWVNHE